MLDEVKPCPDPEKADVDCHLRLQPVIARRDVDQRAGLAAIVDVGDPLSMLDIGNDVVDHRTDIVVRIAGRPCGDVVDIGAGHSGLWFGQFSTDGSTHRFSL